ncbi:MAG: hypothetical protein DKINENOH_03888 [bacterium]|nr:hypothetical protein [bacterium]NUM78882.1 hypothetical protein [candidate division KSB1 bacterium]
MAQKENLLTRLEDFIVWYLPHLESFPRNYKFLLGDRSARILLSASSASSAEASSLPHGNHRREIV